jgi:hypothetical protein
VKSKPDAEPPEQPKVSLFDELYPPELRQAEAEQIATHRKLNGIRSNAPRVGMALSGDGILSATFCLGVFQALAREKLIGKIDFSFYHLRWRLLRQFSRRNVSARRTPCAATVEAKLAGSHSWPVRWLRENGRDMSPNGARDS